MKCLCPICAANITIENSDSLEQGDYTHCPACNKRFWLHRESHVLRAYKKDNAVLCYHCNDKIGATSYCCSCYTSFPDYWVVQKSKPARRKTAEPAFSLELPSFTSRAGKNAELVFADETSGASRFDVAGGLFDRLKSSSVRNLIIILLVISGLVLSGVYYQSYKTKQLFTKKYVKLLYGIQSATDVSLTKLAFISSKDQVLTGKEIAKMRAVKEKIDGLRENIGKIPQEFIQAEKDLTKLYNTYLGLHKLATVTPNIPSELIEKIDQQKRRLRNAKSNLKGNMPEDLLVEVKKVTEKYRNLKYIVR